LGYTTLQQWTSTAATDSLHDQQASASFVVVVVVVDTSRLESNFFQTFRKFGEYI
jgi:hypothetical protein